MGCSGSKAGKANEIAIKPKDEKSESGTKPAEKNPPKAEPAPQIKQEPPTKNTETLKPQKKEPEEGFGIIRSVSSKPGYVEPKANKSPTIEEQVTNWLNLIYSSVKNHL
jgi:hypothetical protein